MAMMIERGIYAYSDMNDWTDNELVVEVYCVMKLLTDAPPSTLQCWHELL